MKFGAAFPTSEIGNDPILIRDFAQTAEGLGYSFIIAYDHVIGAEHKNREPKLVVPYTENDPFHEPLTLFSYLAAITRHMNFQTGILVLPQRQTALVAKQCAELAVLSGNRFQLGAGVGANPVEYESLGVPWDNRGARLEEQIQVLRLLWSVPVIDFDGEFHRIDRGGILPRPEKPIPILLGGQSTAALGRAARIGDGYLAPGAGTFSLDCAKKVKEMLAAEGRADADFVIGTRVNLSMGPDKWHEVRADWEAVGLTHLAMTAQGTGTSWAGQSDPGLTSPQQHIDALETFMREMAG